MLKPAVLHPGVIIGVVAPPGAIEAAQVSAGVRLLEEAGFEVRLGDSVFRRVGYLAGNDAERAADLTAMFRDDEVRAIVAARGGYGSGRLLPCFDEEMVRKHPKVFVGYSDLTFFLTWLLQRVELVTFHGPMVAGLAQSGDGARRLLAMLRGDRTSWNLQATEIIQPGTAEGIICGGCLSVLMATLGTPYEFQTGGRILFLEDVNERPYRIDRMLTQLRQAGKLDGLAGLVFGEMPGCVADPNEAVTVRDVIRQAFC